jgi:hypothetical protein
MKKFLYLFLAFLAFSCSLKLDKNPLVIPPNFNEVPDVTKPEQPAPQQKEENVERLKELLLKSD